MRIQLFPSDGKPRITALSAAERARGRWQWFGGCTQLRNQYLTIGKSLLLIEREGAISRALTALRNKTVGEHGPQRAEWAEVASFRESVVCVPVEVLESYFDDLLDHAVPDERLFISKRSRAFQRIASVVGVLGLFLALLTGLHATRIGMSLPAALSVVALLSLPFFYVLYQFAGNASRRLHFAHIVSKEISRRRGGSGSSHQSNALRDAAERFKGFLAPQSTQPAARSIIH
jgi:uncharacterized membrane protein